MADPGPPRAPQTPDETDEFARVPSPSFTPKPPGPLRRFLMPATHTTEHSHAHKTYPWYNVLWLTGVDYFSSLGYAPGIAFVAAGALSPTATVILVLVTLAGAFPVYSQVAKRSYAGQGSIAMLERLVPGWAGKLLVLTLLGFAMTAWVITVTLSASDAAQHAVENPFLHQYLHGHQLIVTIGLLVILAAVFLRGFSEAIGVAVLIGLPYIVLNVVVIIRCVGQILAHPAMLESWKNALHARGDMTTLLIGSLLVFPKLALGMSGFETGVSVMPLVKGADTPARIQATRKLLLAAALIMSVMLIGSSFVTTLLIPVEAMAPGGKANGRALAFLAHSYLGDSFGTVYDISTITILWFAGASAMAGMLNLIPRYLPRFGMAPEWVQYTRPLVVILLLVNLVVTWAFKADVDAQGGAYATGVLVLMLSAAFAVALALWNEKVRGKSLFFWLITAIFAYTLVDNVIERTDGVIIAAVFIFGIIAASFLSRYSRATELRVEHMHFVDEESRVLWESLKGKKVNLVPTSRTDASRRARKARHIQRYYHSAGPLAFLHVDLTDDRSDFSSELRARVSREEGAIVIDVDGAVAIANAIAWISEELDPIAIYLQLSLQHPFRQTLSYLLWGEGETGLLVREVLVKYWHATPEDDIRPLIFLVSE